MTMPQMQPQSSGDYVTRRFRGPNRRPRTTCMRGHIRALTENRWKQCKECRNLRERAAREAAPRMTISINKSGEACCGNCGAHLEIRCSKGCAEPDIVFKENYIAKMRKPRKDEMRKTDLVKKIRPRKPVPDHCTYRLCTDPVAPREEGATGRPPTRCSKHLELFREKRQKAAA